MDARKSAIFGFQFVKPILQTMTNLIQYMIFEIQFWSVQCTTVTAQYAPKISSVSNPCHQAMQAVAIIILANYMTTNHLKMLLNVFSTTYTYSNCIAYRLFHC